MQRPLCGLATGLTPFAVAGPPLDDVSAAVVPAPPQRQITAASNPVVMPPRTVRISTEPTVVMVQQRDEFILLKVALIGVLATTLAWLTVAQRPGGSSATASPREVPDANAVAATSAREANPLAKPVHRRTERPASATNVVAAASASGRAGEPRHEVPAEALATTLERLGTGLR